MYLEKNKKRALTRFNKEKKKLECKNWWENACYYYKTEYTPKDRIGRNSTTPKSCSCPMCGNARRYMKGNERITIQERRFNDIEKTMF